jgi:hypothetical protein
MPIKAELHADQCPRAAVDRNDGPCTCTPTPLMLTRLSDPTEAASIHGGNPRRLKVLGIVPPPQRYDLPARPEKSQAPRHRAISD